MKIKVIDTPRGSEFIFNNKFSKNRISSDDRKLTSFLHFKYKFINKLHLDKHYTHSGWYRTMSDYWADPSDKSIKAESITKREIILSGNDLQLKTLIIYDLLPKEYLKDFQEKYFKFKTIFSQHYIFNRKEKDLNNSFMHMQNSRVIDCWFNLDFFPIRPESELGEYFSYMSVEAIGLTESFFILKYNLTVTKAVNDFLTTILSKKTYKSPICLSNGKWWKKNSFHGCTPFDFLNDSKTYILEDYILEIKSIFWKQVEDKIFSKFFSWKMLPPSIEIYSSDTLNSNIENIISLLSSHNETIIEQNDQGSVYLMFSCDDGRWPNLHNSKIIANSSEFDDKEQSGICSFYMVEDIIGKELSDYFVLDALKTKISNSITSAQLQINKVVGSKRKLKSYLKIKFNIDRKLYFYRRLYNELTKQLKSKTKKCTILETYSKNFINSFIKKNPGSKYPFDFTAKYKSLYYSLTEKHSLLQSIYKHFDENAKMVENRYNFNLVKWTFWIGFLSLIATIIFSNNYHILNAIWKWITALFE